MGQGAGARTLHTPCVTHARTHACMHCCKQGYQLIPTPLLCKANPHLQISTVASLQVAFKLFGVLPGAVGLRGKVLPLDGRPEWVQVRNGCRSAC